MAETAERTLQERIAFAMAMTKEDFDWEANDWPDMQDAFRACLAPAVPEDGPFAEFSSVKAEDTPVWLYRLLWLVGPQQPIDFSDMYKTRLFAFMDAEQQCIVEAYLFKYELGLYFHCRTEDIVNENASILHGGWPGAENGWRCKNETVNQFVEMVKAVVGSAHMVYSGNDFEV